MIAAPVDVARRSIALVALGLAGCSAPGARDEAVSKPGTTPSTTLAGGDALPIPSNSVLTRHNDNSRSGSYLHETTLTAGAVQKQGISVKYHVPVDGGIVVQPLFTPAGSVFSTDTVYVATANNTVYAIDASTGTARWFNHLVDPRDGGIQSGIGGTTSSGNCAQYKGNPPPDSAASSYRCYANGIQSTPVIDPSSGILYAVYGNRNTNRINSSDCWHPPPSQLLRGCQWQTSPACPFGCDPSGNTLEGPVSGGYLGGKDCSGSWADNWYGGPTTTKNGVVSGFMPWWNGVSGVSAPFNMQWDLVAINLSNGSVIQTTPIAATSEGVTFDPRKQQPRTGLLLNGGHLYLGFSAQSEAQAVFHGWVLRYDTSNLAESAAYVTTPTVTRVSEGGGVWQAGGGIASDSAGNVYFATGNGQSDAANHGDSIIKLNAALQPVPGAPPYTPQHPPEFPPPQSPPPFTDDCSVNGDGTKVQGLTYPQLLDYWDLERLPVHQVGRGVSPPSRAGAASTPRACSSSAT